MLISFLVSMGEEWVYPPEMSLVWMAMGADIYGALAQLVARYIRIVEVRSSNLLCSTNIRLFEPFSFRGKRSDRRISFVQKNSRDDDRKPLRILDP